MSGQTAFVDSSSRRVSLPLLTRLDHVYFSKDLGLGYLLLKKKDYRLRIVA